MNIYIWIGVIILLINIALGLLKWYQYVKDYKKDDHYNENMPEEARG